MFNKLRTLFMVLIIIICGAANADLAAIAYADYEAVENEVEQGHAAQGMDVILNENIYEIQQETSKNAVPRRQSNWRYLGQFPGLRGSFLDAE